MCEVVGERCKDKTQNLDKKRGDVFVRVPSMYLRSASDAVAMVASSLLVTAASVSLLRKRRGQREEGQPNETR